MRQMPMTTEWRRSTALHRFRGTAHWAHSQVQPLGARIMSAQSLVPCVHFITLTFGSSSSVVRTTHDHHHGHPCGCCLFDLTSFFPLRLPLVCLPPQRRAAAGAHQEDHGKPVRLRYQQGVRAPTTSSTSPQLQVNHRSNLEKFEKYGISFLQTCLSE